jgi:hypothetical protein
MSRAGKSREEYIKQINQIHGDRYNLSLLPKDKIRQHDKVTFICYKHGEFIKTFGEMLRKNRTCGCPKCSYENLFHSRDEWVQMFNSIHKNYYNYDLAKSISNDDVIPIICPKHGVFYRTAETHKVCGCPKCRRSKGESITSYILRKNHIEFISQQRFADCRGKRYPLPFDFYIPSMNTLIEYNGRQHYYGWENRFGKCTNSLENIQLHDKIKYDYCVNKNIRLIVIKYNQDVYEVLLQEGIITGSDFPCNHRSASQTLVPQQGNPIDP